MSRKTTPPISKEALSQNILLTLLQYEKGHSFGSLPHLVGQESVEPEQVHKVLTGLQEKGLVKPVQVSSRGWSAAGHALTVKGERACDKIKGRDAKAVEQELCKGIVRSLEKQLDVEKGMHISSFPKQEGVGPARMEAAVKLLMAKGILLEKPVRVGLHKETGYALTSQAIRRIKQAQVLVS